MLCSIVELVRLCCQCDIGNLLVRWCSVVFVRLRLFFEFLKLIGLILCGIVDELILLVFVFCLKQLIEMQFYMLWLRLSRIVFVWVIVLNSLVMQLCGLIWIVYGLNVSFRWFLIMLCENVFQLNFGYVDRCVLKLLIVLFILLRILIFLMCVIVWVRWVVMFVSFLLSVVGLVGWLCVCDSIGCLVWVCVSVMRCWQIVCSVGRIMCLCVLVSIILCDVLLMFLDVYVKWMNLFVFLSLVWFFIDFFSQYLMVFML